MLSRLLGRPRTWLIAHDDTPLAPDQLAHWRDWLARRLDGEPLAYLLGEKEFAGLMLEVDADVLVPRPDTEIVVDWADALLRQRAAAGGSLLDLGTGSGAIAVAIKSRHPGLEVVASDRSAAALGVARANALRHALVIEFVSSSWWDALDDRRFDLVVSNPPYIAADDVALADLRHEPIGALTPGGDGLGALAEIVAGAMAHLRPNGWLLLEHGFAQGASVRSMLAAAGFSMVETRRDLAGLERVSGARLPPAAA